MRILNLKVSNGITDEPIQNIEFKTSGLNLIVDNDKEQKSNNIGKSTVIHSIDFCLGGNKSIFFKGAGKSHNDSTIEEFLYREHIIFELKLKDEGGKIYIIKRGFQKSTTKTGKEKRETIWFLNDKKINSANKLEELKSIFFGDSDSKPTFRELIHKFLRDDSFSLGDAIRFYHNNTTSETGRAILDRLFHNNIASIPRIKELHSDIKDLENIGSKHRKRHDSIKELEEHISKQESSSQNDREIFKQKLELSLPSHYVTEYQEARLHYKLLIDDIISIKMDINSLEISINRYKNDKSNIDTVAVQTLYNEMQLYNNTLNKTFEDTIVFHNSMLENRIIYLKKALDIKKNTLKEKEETQKLLLNKYDQFVIDIDEKRLEEVEKFSQDSSKILANIEINRRALKEWIESEEQLKKTKEELSTLENNPNTSSDSINIFNKYFEQYTQEIYEAKMYLSVPEDYKPYTLKNVRNTGTGKEKAIITIFDLAYLAYIDEINKTSPRFTAIDVFEPTDEPSIKKIFEIANSLDSQLIIPVLRSKVKFIKDFEKYIILELNNDDKFFKLD